MQVNEETRRKLIYSYCDLNPSATKSDIVHYFQDVGFSRKTVYGILKRREANISHKRQKTKRSDNPFSRSEVRQELKMLTVGKVAKSYRLLGRRFNCDPKTVKEELLSMNIKRKARKKCPKVSEKQRVLQKQRVKLMAKNILFPQSKVKIVMDDESYFKGIITTTLLNQLLLIT